MKKPSLLALAVVFCLPAAAFANDFMGAPAASLKEGQFDVGLNYTWTNMDLKSSDVKRKDFANGQAIESGKVHGFGAVKDVKMNKVMVSLGTSIMENWDVYILLGGATLETQHLDRLLFPKTNNVDADPTFVYGFGTRATFWQEGDWAIGGLAQVTFAQNFDASNGGSFPDAPGVSYVGKYGIDITEIQLAVGPRYILAPGWTVYGGPFAHFVSGNFSSKYVVSQNGFPGGITIKESGDLEERAWLGGYIGTQYEIVENLNAAIEYQHTAWSDAFGANIAYKF